jgi:hypothetical protein
VLTAEITLVDGRQVVVVRGVVTGVAVAIGTVVFWLEGVVPRAVGVCTKVGAVAPRGVVEVTTAVLVQVMVALPGVTFPELPGLVKSGVISWEMAA